MVAGFEIERGIEKMHIKILYIDISNFKSRFILRMVHKDFLVISNCKSKNGQIDSIFSCDDTCTNICINQINLVLK